MPCSALPAPASGDDQRLPSTLAPHGQAGPLPSTSWCLPRPLRARRACPQSPAHSLSSLPQKPGPTVLFGGGCLLSRFPHVSSSPMGGGAPRQGSPHTHEPSWNRACPGAGWRGRGGPWVPGGAPVYLQQGTAHQATTGPFLAIPYLRRFQMEGPFRPPLQAGPGDAVLEGSPSLLAGPSSPIGSSAVPSP